MTETSKKRLIAVLDIIAVSGMLVVAVAGCRTSENHAQPTTQAAVQNIQNNPHIPPQAKMAAVSAIQSQANAAQARAATQTKQVIPPPKTPGT